MLKKLRKRDRKQMILVTVIGFAFFLILRPLYEWDTAEGITCYMFGGAGLLASILSFFWLITGSDVAGIRKAVRKNGWNVEEIESDIDSGYDKRDCHIGHKYMLLNSNWRWNIYLLHDVIWIYQYTRTTDHRLYGAIEIGTTVVYSVQFHLRNGKKKTILMKSEREAQEVLKFFAQTQPHVIVGYSDELRTICQNNFNQLLQLSNEKEMVRNQH